LPDKLGRLMFDYAALIRRYRDIEMAKIEEAARLTERDLAILNYVYDKGEATFGEIANELHFKAIPRSSASAISQAITALYTHDGLVEKRLNPKDQRQPIVTLTEKGRTVVEKVRAVRIDIYNKVKLSMDLSQEESAVIEEAYSRGITNFKDILEDMHK